MFQHVLFVFFMEIGSSKRTPFTNIMCQAGSQTKHVKALYGQIMILYDQLRHTCTCLVQSMTLYDQNQNILCRNYDFTSLYAKTTTFYGQTTAFLENFRKSLKMHASIFITKQLALHQDNGKWCFVLSNIHHFWKPVVWWKKNCISIWVSFIPLVA